jgi:hypothetical protein
VVAPYTATGKEQLTLSRGQMILVRKKTDTGWWQGEIQAVSFAILYFVEHRGIFRVDPDQYSEICDPSSSTIWLRFSWQS